MKQPPTKEQVLRLIESCGSPGAKLAVGLVKIFHDEHHEPPKITDRRRTAHQTD
jgi:hypothetical protein